MADEKLDDPDMMGELLRKRQRLAHQAPYPWPPRVVEALDMIGEPRLLRDGSVVRRRHDAFVHPLRVGIKRGVLTLRFRNLGPQAPGTSSTAIPHGEGNALATLDIHREPHPLRGGLLLHQAVHVICFDRKPVHRDILPTADERDGPMVWQRGNPWHEKAQEPREVNTYSATETAQRYTLHQQAFDQGSCVLRDHMLRKALDKLSPTVWAFMVLFAMVNMTIFLVVVRSTLRADSRLTMAWR